MNAPRPDPDDLVYLIRRIAELAVVHGRVTLSSGREADYYVDMRRVTLDGLTAPVIGRVMRGLVSDWSFDAVGGLTLGADPVATSMLHAAAAEAQVLDAFVVRKAEKAHGLQRRIEGSPVAGRRVLVVEDTSTTGALRPHRRRGAAGRGRGGRRGRRGRRPGHGRPGARARRGPRLPLGGVGRRPRASADARRAATPA